MVFSSLEFIFWFLPFFIVIYYLLPKKLKNLCIFVFSLCFYAYGAIETPSYIALIFISVIINYILGLKIENSKKHRKAYFVVGVIFDFGCLFIFKYADFFIENLNILFGKSGFSLPLTDLILPIGISFYTFQIVSYLADVYRGTVKAEKSFINLGAYIIMFPQLIAGPIVRFQDIQKDLKCRKHSGKMFTEGVKLFVLGLGYKVLLANQIGNLWNDINSIGYESISTPLAWMGIYAYSMQIYFDFFGYSLMAIGLGKLIGFTLPQNFNNPYVSHSMTEFWRRWHMTLGSWFREYVYIPLGGNRKGQLRTYINLLTVWFFTGFWHGADWNFVLWGLMLFLIIAFEKSAFGKILNKHKGFGRLYMFFLIPLSWLVFAVDDLNKLAVYAGRLFGIGGNNIFAGDFIKYRKTYGILMLIGLVFCTALPSYLYKKFKNNSLIYPLLLTVFGLSVYCLYMGMNDPFMYFRF